jgi:hypothetical protein
MVEFYEGGVERSKVSGFGRYIDKDSNQYLGWFEE